MKKLNTFFFFSIIFLTSINYSFSIEPDVFVQSTVNRAAKTLGGNLTKVERVDKLKEIARETVDISGIGFYSLGKHRKGLSSAQLENYIKVFEEYFLKSFSSRLAEYSNPEIEVNSKEKLNDNYTIVSSTLVATDKRPEVKIDWRIYTKDPENLLIRDLIIEKACSCPFKPFQVWRENSYLGT
jgi:phospholipid transport system substrate-binding protein